MATTEKSPEPRKVPSELHLVCGAGGSRAILGTSGAILCSHALNIDGWKTVGGVSGGSIPSVMFAAGVSPSEIARHVIEIDFNSMLTPRKHMLGILWAFFLKECAWKRKQERGVLTSEKVGEFVDRFVTSWPKAYWTVAVADGKPLLFTADGVFEYKPDGTRVQISSKPASVGLAVRGSCAVPGIIDAVEFQGSLLLDGGLAADGRCPVNVVKKQFGAAPGTIVACDVGESSMDTARSERWYWKAIRRLVCGPCCDPEQVPLVNAHDVVLVQADVTNMQSLEFKLSPDQKWAALMSGFKAAFATLEKTGWASASDIERVRGIVAAYAEIEKSAATPGDLASRTEALLTGSRLY